MKLLSLFDRAGELSRAWREAGESVTAIDLLVGTDIRGITRESLTPPNPRFDFIIAAPPAAVFDAFNTAHFFRFQRDGRTAAAMALVDRAAEIMAWAGAPSMILFPGGRSEICPRLAFGRAVTFAPCEYGDAILRRWEAWLFNGARMPDPVFTFGKGKGARTGRLLPQKFLAAVYLANT